MTRMRLTASCIVLVLAASTLENARAEHWIQTSPKDSRVWYDTDDVHSTSDGPIGVGVSRGPSRLNPQGKGSTSYPTYSIVNCLHRTAGSKMSLDSGEGLKTFALNLGMGELIDKLCS